MKNEREIVLSILLEQEEKGTYSHIVIRETLDRYADLPDAQRSFIKRLSEGTIERELELDALLNQYLKKPVSTLRPVVRAILRMGAYQILYMDAVPDRAACNEAVKLIKGRKMNNLSAFVNGVLRNVARNHAAGDAGNQETQGASTRYSMPQWILDLWTSQYGEEVAEGIAKAMLEVRPVSVRMKNSLTDAEKKELIRLLEEKGVEVAKGNYLPYAYTLTHTKALSTLPGYAEGKWTVQDESSMLVAQASGLKPGMKVYDVCAAPGGKSMHAAALTAPDGVVRAFDLSERKCEKIRENAKRMQLTNLVVEKRDATKVYEDAVDSADVVLCDLPCSGLGVMGKKRDIKYRIQEEDLDALVVLQQEMLRHAVTYVKPGGTLLYSTCTINRKENEEQALFIEETLGLVPRPLEKELPYHIPGIQGHMLQLMPQIHHTDGFFLASFTRPV